MDKTKELHRIFQSVGQNWRNLAFFEFFYSLAAAIVLVPLINAYISLVMRLSGYSYLTLENISAFLLHPATLAMILLFLIIAVLFGLIDVSAVIYAFDQGNQQKHARMTGILGFSIKNTMRMLNPRNLPFVALLLLFFPLLSIGLIFAILATISIPEFITLYTRSHVRQMLLIGALILFVTALLIRWLFAFHYYTLEKCSFREACRRSRRLSSGHRLSDLLQMLFVQLLFGAASIGIILLGVTLGAAAERLFRSVNVLRWLSYTVIWFIIVFAILLAFSLATPVSCGYISRLYYVHKLQSGEPILHTAFHDYDPSDPRTRKRSRIYTLIGLAAIFGSLALGYLMESRRLNPQIEYLNTPEITAHRGASRFYPENTLASVVGAWELGADWVEIDVQQTKDGQVIVMHDANLKRTTGVNAYTWDLTYDEISRLEAGSFFSTRFTGEKIPLLSEIAAYAQENGLQLNIELKPNGHETNLEQQVIDIIKEYELENDCVITSQVYETLKNVKACDEEITTVYVMSFAYGDVNQLTAADHFSVEATSATRALVSRVHNAGKQIYAWTVNSKNSINTMISHNVDNIITDDVSLARSCVSESRYSDLLSEYIRMLQ